MKDGYGWTRKGNPHSRSAQKIDTDTQGLNLRESYYREKISKKRRKMKELALTGRHPSQRSWAKWNEHTITATMSSSAPLKEGSHRRCCSQEKKKEPFHRAMHHIKTSQSEVMQSESTEDAPRYVSWKSIGKIWNSTHNPQHGGQHYPQFLSNLTFPVKTKCTIKIPDKFSACLQILV